MFKIDLFNKKKIKWYSEQLEISRVRCYELEKKVKELNKIVESSEKISTKTIEENQKLINWIMNILKEFGTCEIGDRKHVEIPIHSQNICSAYDRNYMGVFEKERIEIPSITIVKMG